MAGQGDDEKPQATGTRYVWPWFVLGAVILGIILSVLWLSHEIERTRRIRDLNAPPPPISTNANGKSA